MTEETEHQSIEVSDSLRVKALIRASFIAMGADVFLALLKYILSTITGNPVLVADALHSGADFAVSLVVLLSILVKYTFQGSRRARHAEALVAFLISLLLIFGSFQMFRYVWVNAPGTFMLVSGIPLVIAFAGISLVLFITLKMSEFKKRTGRKYRSDAFSAEGDHTFSDFLSSVSVWATLLLGYFGIHIERAITLLIGIMVLNIGIKLFFKSIKKFGMKFQLLSGITDKLHTDVLGRLRATKEQCRRIVEKLNLKFVLLPGLVIDKMRAWVVFNIFLVLSLYFGTGFYMVRSYQTGLELLFGEVVEKNGPGLHYHLPQPFGNALMVDTSLIIRLESGFRTDMNYRGKKPDMYLWENMHNEGRYTKVPEEALAIAGDENLIDVNFLCYYKIVDPVQYALNIENAHETLRHLFVYEIHSVCARYSLDDLLSSKRVKIQELLLSRMSHTAKVLSMGVDILNIDLQEAHPPVEVIPQYRNISSAREKMDEIIHQASAYANDLLPRSRGESATVVLNSKAYAAEKMNIAQGETESFMLRQRNFSRYEAVQKARIWWETTEKLLMDKPLYILPSEAERRFVKNEDKKSRR